MKGFDSSSEEEEDDNIGLLNFDSDDEEDVDELKQPKIKSTPGKPAPTKKKSSVNERKVIIMTALITLCGKQRANKFLHASISARNAIF